ncbi:MAG: type V CRISPR-associated protein Cas4, partial [Succinivibrio sp.]
ILFAHLNDFIFCPVSIYFHQLYGEQAEITYQNKDQLLGIDVHKSIDTRTYSSSKNVLQGIDCYCSKYNLVGKIDLYDVEKRILTERKRTIKTVFDGYVFQLYAQYFSLKEMGYDVKIIRLYSYTDNKIYEQPLPENNKEMLDKFEKLVKSIKEFEIDHFSQTNISKCQHCIYEAACDRSLL